MARRGLGKGLKALMPDRPDVTDDATASEVEVEAIQPNPYQPRQRFSGPGMDELVESIRQHGVVQPLLVRRFQGGYQIIAGERRWRAAQEAGHQRVPVVVRECSEQDMMEIALVENLQREDLNPLEEGMAYRRLLEEFDLTQEEVAERVGKSRSQVANTLRLLQLHPLVREMLESGALSAGHARALLALEGAAQVRLAQRVVRENLNVRQLEHLVRVGGRSPVPRRPASPEVKEVEERLAEALGTSVRISGERRGFIRIRFYSPDDLGRLMELLLSSDS